jgi:hypothetical protein
MNKVMQTANGDIGYYYQHLPEDDKYLPGKWACCGIAVEKSRNFYTDWFSTHDARGRNFDRSVMMDVKIVPAYMGGAVDNV